MSNSPSNTARDSVRPVSPPTKGVLLQLGLTVECKESQPLSALVEPFLSHKAAENPKHDADRAPIDLTPGVLTPQQAKELLATARRLHGGQLVAYSAIRLFAGLRPAEIARLEPNHINLETGTILVRGKVRNANGLRSQRLVPIESGLSAILGTLDFAKQTLAIDTSGHSRLMWATTRAGANLLESWDPDCMRHSYCSYRLARGDSVEAVARDAGNSPITLTKYYLHPRTKKEALEYWALR